VLQISSKQAEVFDEEGTILRCMLSVQPMSDIIAHIDLINNLIGVFLQCRSEDDDLIVLCHQLDELDATGTDEEEAVLAVFHIVDESLIQIKNESVD